MEKRVSLFRDWYIDWYAFNSNPRVPVSSGALINSFAYIKHKRLSLRGTGTVVESLKLLLGIDELNKLILIFDIVSKNL